MRSLGVFVYIISCCDSVFAIWIANNYKNLPQAIVCVSNKAYHAGAAG